MEHTKGKWEVKDAGEGTITFVESGEFCVCQLAYCNLNKRDAHTLQLANARLIAAAPASLDSHRINAIEAKASLQARKLWKHGTSLEPVINGFIECLQRIVKRSEQAIAEAEKE